MFSIARSRLLAASTSAECSAILASIRPRDHGAFGHVTPTRASTPSVWPA